jgi:hypothetical protein
VDLDNGLSQLCFVKNGIKSDVGLAIQRTMAERCQKLDSKSRNYLFYGVTKITFFGNGCIFRERMYSVDARQKDNWCWICKHGFPVRCGAIADLQILSVD